MFRIAPKAVCRQWLATIKQRPLSNEEWSELLRAIDSTDVEDGKVRLLAGLTRGTIISLLDRC